MSKQSLMEDVMDLQLCLQAMLKKGECPILADTIDYLLSDELPYKIGKLETGIEYEQDKRSLP